MSARETECRLSVFSLGKNPSRSGEGSISRSVRMECYPRQHTGFPGNIMGYMTFVVFGYLDKTKLWYPVAEVSSWQTAADMAIQTIDDPFQETEVRTHYRPEYSRSWFLSN